MDGISPNFKNAFLLARSRLGLLSVIVYKFVTEVLSLIDESATAGL